MKLTLSLLLAYFLCTGNIGCHGNSSPKVLYSNSWAVEVKGGHHVANELARKHGFINKGQAGGLEDVYNFIDRDSPSRVRRSTGIPHPKHSNLIAEDHVSYVEQQIVKTRVKRDHSIIYSSPTDNSWGNQWYLHRPSGHHMNVEKAWEQDIIGRGGVVSILDDGIEYTHADLKDNYDPLASYDFNGHDKDPFPRYDYSNENKHGTRCAGEVAANRNGKCGVGVAYGAKVGGVRMLDGDVTDVVEASSLSLNRQHIDIYSSSWGPNDDGATVDGPGPLARKAFLDGIERGRGGLGSLFVWAAGNGGRYGDSCNCDGYAVSPYTISVGSAAEYDDVPWYLEKCSSTITSTYSSGGTSEKEIVTTDLHGSCTVHHTGTSAAAPLAAGILTLALEANANLTWRDVQYLLVYTANPNFAHENFWTTNGAGLRVSHMFGFGIMDATALVNRARNWITVTPRVNCSVNVSKTLAEDAVATTGQPLNIKASFSDNCKVTYIEHTQAFVTLHSVAGQRKDISISLTSPSGTKSILLPHRRMDKSRDGLHNWPFMTVHTWGEKPDGGAWMFSIKITGGGKIKLLGLELVVHGTQSTPRSLRDIPIPSECHPECKGGCSAPGPSFCDDCNHFRMASSLACVGSCPRGTFQNHHTCRDCPDLCTECSDEHVCVKCADGAVRLDSGLCADKCPALTFLAQDHSCQGCHHSCLSCDGLTDGDCTECPSQLTLQEGQCVIRNPESCPAGKYFDHRALECRSCHASCANCSGKDSDQCTVCREGYSRSDNGKCVPTVYLNCTSGHYVDQESLQCNPCPDGCSNCTTNTTCTLCDLPLFLTTGGECVAVCPNNTIMDDGSRLCLNTHCSEFCLTCYGREAALCSSCVNGSILFDNACVQQCPGHTYKVAGNSSCQHCHGSCASCNGPLKINCLSCPSGKYFRGNECLSTCPPGTRPSDHGGDCQLCPDKCAKCSATVSCDVCQDGYLLLVSDHTCVVGCPKGFIKQYSSRSCQPCPPNCDVCYDLENCQKCDNDHVYYAPNRSCQSRCPDGYYSDPSGANCNECKHPCSTCVSSPTNCLSCGRAMAPDKASNSCVYCCNSDKAIVLPCCDCDVSTTECIKRNHLDPTESLVFDTKMNNKPVLVGLIAFAAVSISVIVIGLGIYFFISRFTQRFKKSMKYKSLGDKGLEIVDDSESEAEIYCQQTTKGYTSVDTIDHDRL